APVAELAQGREGLGPAAQEEPRAFHEVESPFEHYYEPPDLGWVHAPIGVHHHDIATRRCLEAGTEGGALAGSCLLDDLGVGANRQDRFDRLIRRTAVNDDDLLDERREA